MVGTYSPEGRIITLMKELHLEVHELAAICPVVGRTRLSQALNPNPAQQKDLKREDAERILETLERMKELFLEIPELMRGITRIHWNNTEAVQVALTTRLADKIAREEHDDTRLSALAQKATAAVMEVAPQRC